MLSTAASNISPNFPMEIFCTSTKMPRVASTRISDSGRSDALPGFGVVVGSLGPENDQGPALSSVDELRALIQYFIPIVEVADCRFTEGKPTGLVVPASGADGSSVILIGGHVLPQSVMMLAELPNPSVREVDIFKTLVQVAVAREDSATILTWPSDGKCLWFETAFHIGLPGRWNEISVAARNRKTRKNCAHGSAGRAHKLPRKPNLRHSTRSQSCH